MSQIYWVISQILLFWHAVWQKVVSSGSFLGTNWSWILAIVFLVLTVRAVLFPVFVKQIKSQRAMQSLQPKVKELQEKHKGDRETLQKELMELYRKEKANPLMGCLPMFLQIPVFLGLFHVLKHLKPTMPARLQTLYGWTAGQFESASHAKLFGAPISARFLSPQVELDPLNASQTNVKIVAVVLIAIMIATTFMTSRQMILKTGWSEDPQQKMIQRLMLYGVPATLLFSGGAFPLGVVIYWVTTNLFSLGQQFWVLRKYPPPPNAKKATGSTATGSTRSTPNAGRSTSGAAKGGSGANSNAGGFWGLLGRGASSKAAPAKAASTKPAAKKASTAKKDSANNGGAGKDDSAAAVDSKPLAPRVGAKPINPKKGGPAKRQAR
jgi:YidC/Oxa1 family membrane protein insertase